MAWTHDAVLEIALDRLEWALRKAGKQYYQREAIPPLIRALLSVEKALLTHTAAADGPGGAFRRLVDPSALPFTPLAQHVGELRQEHIALQRRATTLRSQLEGALHTVPADFGPADAAETALRQRLGELCKSGRPLLADIQRHRNVERDLIVSSDA
jgi:hypothetical protein